MFIGFVALFLIVLLFSKIGKLERRITDLERGSWVKSQTPLEVPSTKQEAFVPVPPIKGDSMPLPSQPVTLEALMRAAPSAPPQQSDVVLSKEAMDDVVVRPAPESRFITWLKEDWLIKVGAFVIFLGFVWLVSYAFSNGWVGPIGKIGLGLVAGTAILILGWKRMMRFPAQGSIFLVLGAVVILLVTFAGRSLYHFFTPASAMAIMFLSCAFLAFMSVKFDRFSLALSGLILAGLVPLFVSTGVPNYVGLYSYLMIVVLGSLWVVAVTEWKGITLGALLLIVFYSAPQLAGTTAADLGVTLLFIYAFTGLFFLANIVGIIRRKKSALQIDLTVAMINGLNILAWIHVGAVENWRSLIMSAWMLLFVIGAFLISLATKRKEPFYVYAGIGLSMLATATAEELHGASLTLAYMFETVAVILVTQQILRNTRITQKMSFLVIGPALLTIRNVFSPAWDTGVFHQDFAVVLAMILVFFGLGIYFRAQKDPADTPEAEDANKVVWVNHLVLGAVYTTMLLALIFDGANLTIAYILEALTLVFIVSKLFGNIHMTEKASLLMAGPVLLSTQSMVSSTWGTGVFHKDFVVMGMMILAFFGISAYFKTQKGTSDMTEDDGRSAWVSHFVLGLVYITMLLALIYDGADLTLAYIVETVAIILVAAKLFKSPVAAENLNFLAFVPALLSLQSMTSPAWNTSVFHKDFLVLLLVVALFAWIASRLQKAGTTALRFIPAYLGSSAFFASVLLWIALHAGFDDKDSATTLSLVMYTIVGIWGYTKGKLHEKNALRIGGLIFLSFVLARLFFVDIWQMDIAGRIVTFFVVGALLMSTAFYTRKPVQNIPKP